MGHLKCQDLQNIILQAKLSRDFVNVVLNDFKRHL